MLNLDKTPRNSTKYCISGCRTHIFIFISPNRSQKKPLSSCNIQYTLFHYSNFTQEPYLSRVWFVWLYFFLRSPDISGSLWVPQHLLGRRLSTIICSGNYGCDLGPQASFFLHLLPRGYGSNSGLGSWTLYLHLRELQPSFDY